MSIDKNLLQLAAFYRDSGDLAGLQSTVSQLSKEGPHYKLALLEVIKLRANQATAPLLYSASHQNNINTPQSENSGMTSKFKHKR